MKTNWIYPEVNSEFGLSVYGPESVKFTEIFGASKKQIEPREILYKGLLQKAESDNSGWNPLASKGLFKNVTCKFEHSTIGYGFYAFRNGTPRNLEIVLTLSRKLNISLCKFFVYCLSSLA